LAQAVLESQAAALGLFLGQILFFPASPQQAVVKAAL
jgi:hypothetical protein